MDTSTLLLSLLLAHLIGDFCLQPKGWVDDRMQKKARSKGLYKHVGVHALLALAAFRFDPAYWIGYVALVGSHWLIDLLKAHFETERNGRLLFVLDQSAHLAVIAVVVSVYEPIVLHMTTDRLQHFLLLAVCLVLVTFVGAIVIKVAISKWTPQLGAADDESLAKAGRMIGMLERLFVFIFVATGHWEGVGFLLAAKSVFRFGDLKESKDRKLTEYILIGTLLSFGWAMLVGMAYAGLGI